MPREHAGRLSDAILELRRSGAAPSDDEAIDALLDRLSEPPGPADERTELSGPHELLHEATLVAIDEAGERLSTACTNLLRREGESSEVRAEVGAIDSLLWLLETLEQAD